MTEQLYTYEQMLEWRHIASGDACLRCQGSGVTVYPSTALWRGGIGGRAMSNGICCKCWGSGSRTNPGISVPKYEALVKFHRDAVAACDPMCCDDFPECHHGR